MTQVIIINDTGATIAAAATITLDGVNKVPPVRYINSGVIVNLYNGSTTAAPAATATVLASTASAPTSGYYAYRITDNTIKIGKDIEVHQMLVLDVELEDEYVRT